MDIPELTVAVVEPSTMQGKIIEAELNALGIDKILYQRSGQAALETMLRIKPDLVISAMYLPDMTGAELVVSMREDEALQAVPFMLISSETSFAMLDPVRQAGVIAILPKPFATGDLRKALYSTVEFITPDEDALADIVLDELKTLVVDDSSMARKHTGDGWRNPDPVYPRAELPALYSDSYGHQRRRPEPPVSRTTGRSFRNLRQTIRYHFSTTNDSALTGSIAGRNQATQTVDHKF